MASRPRDAPRPSDPSVLPSSQTEGAGNAGLLAATHGPPAEKKAGGSHHRFSRATGIPRAAI
ncbi:hypothetical protein BRAO285_2940081 [Bradyrhizobium sp. ORS 285]|nr:hypothetical protein BRAO285_2940081 [Bradyrhizobium sp. ORS 285]